MLIFFQNQIEIKLQTLDLSNVAIVGMDGHGPETKR